MPVSTPGYFPPQRGNTGSIVGTTAGARIDPTTPHMFLAGQSAGNDSGATDLVVIGDHALSTGSGIAGSGSVIIGSQAAKLLTDFDSGDTGACVIIGGNAGSSLLVGGGNVLVGVNVLQHAGLGGAVCTANTIVGSDAVGGFTTREGSNVRAVTAMGYQTLQGNDTEIYDLANVVAIGDRIAIPVQADILNSVFIGSRCGQLLGAQPTNLSTFVGSNIAQAEIEGAQSCTIIGANACNGGATTNPAPVNCLGIGAWLKTIGAQDNVFIGNFCGAGQGDAVGKLLIEIDSEGSGGNPRALVWGDFTSGTLIVGSSTAAERADTGALNALQFVNGNHGATDPVNGGYLYVAEGALFYVGSTGRISQLALA